MEDTREDLDEEMAALEEAPAIAAAREEPKAPWREGKWKSLTNFECTSCKFSTLHKANIEEHVEKAHGIKKPQLYAVDGSALL
jgi:hypothetical protein